MTAVLPSRSTMLATVLAALLLAPASWAADPAVAPQAGSKPAKSAAKAVAKPASGPAAKSDQVQLDATSITGQKGLPRVLYIVPWKRAGADDSNGGPDGSLLDEVLAPVDRTEFRRQQRYADSLGSSDASPATEVPK